MQFSRELAKTLLLILTLCIKKTDFYGNELIKILSTSLNLILVLKYTSSRSGECKTPSFNVRKFYI